MFNLVLFSFISNIEYIVLMYNMFIYTVVAVAGFQHVLSGLNEPAKFNLVISPNLLFFYEYLRKQYRNIPIPKNLNEILPKI